ncbi:MAG: hypothetical protein GXP16_00200 [Gammaproteobacteria bacterium]|nr:hypothetical protein [Gammaproteobacteria bacterium]
MLNPELEEKMTQPHVELPLFPLRTVLFPGGVIPLRVFEPRYVDMVGRCMRNGHGFGVVLIRAGSESRSSRLERQPEIFNVGTQASILIRRTMVYSE